MELKNYIEKLGLVIGIVTMIWLLRIYIIISFGYHYVAYEDNLFILYSEILSLLLGIVILLVMLYRRF